MTWLAIGLLHHAAVAHTHTHTLFLTVSDSCCLSQRCAALLLQKSRQFPPAPNHLIDAPTQPSLANRTLATM
jgi:hypothetical protein